jgi:hypothetical protein
MSNAAADYLKILTLRRREILMSCYSEQTFGERRCQMQIIQAAQRTL